MSRDDGSRRIAEVVADEFRYPPILASMRKNRRSPFGSQCAAMMSFRLLIPCTSDFFIREFVVRYHIVNLAAVGGLVHSEELNHRVGLQEEALVHIVLQHIGYALIQRERSRKLILRALQQVGTVFLSRLSVPQAVGNDGARKLT